jgi:hypothetical protein
MANNVQSLGEAYTVILCEGITRLVPNLRSNAVIGAITLDMEDANVAVYLSAPSLSYGKPWLQDWIQ